MASVGTTSNRTADGKDWNEVSAFRASDGSIEFRLRYTDPETRRIRFFGRGDSKKPDEIVFRMDDMGARAALASLLADSIEQQMHREEMLKRMRESGDLG